jgi:hypothetical protein
MTPEGLISELAALVVAHRDRDALELVSRLLPTMAPAMTAEQITRVADMMHGAEMAVDLEDSARLKATTRSEPQSARSA